MEELTYEEQGHLLRAEIKAVAEKAKAFIRLSEETTPPADDNVSRNGSEMIDSATLAYRDLQMAAMWVGKAMQAYQGGISILDNAARDAAIASKAVTGAAPYDGAKTEALEGSCDTQEPCENHPGNTQG